ncbi:MAG: nickel pincer cofactor biosynthesis protein LarC [Candidatus Bathyarchaeia archaeon]
MTSKSLVVDCQIAGIAGDMLVSALLDLGVDIEAFKKALGRAGDYLPGDVELVIGVEEVNRCGFQAKKLTVHTNGEAHQHGHHHVHGSDVRGAIDDMTRDLGLSEEARGLALNAIDSLIDAEASMHGSSREEVHLHEAGSVDTVVDIVGTAYAMEELELFGDTRVYSTPVAVGGGLFSFSHGTVSSPAPATLEILRTKKFPLVGGPIKFELTTPTGAALLVNIVHEISMFYPKIRPLTVGYGAGTKDFEVMPNVVRLTIGDPVEPSFLSDEVYVLETNLDDVTGEVMGHAIDHLIESGAKDVSVIPTTTKKNRPGFLVKVITGREDVRDLTMALMQETGTLGVRMHPCQRHILPREITESELKLDGGDETIRVKVSRTLEGRILQVKPEYDDLSEIAERTGKPLRVVMDMAREKALKETQ